MICNLCRGRSSLFIVQDRVKEWYNCPACGGNGVRDPIFPACIAISGSQQKIIAKAEQKRLTGAASSNN
jgi:hypothetical protein